MCLYPKFIDNKKYQNTKKNGGRIPPVIDERVLKVPVNCGKCIECLKQKSREWQVRLFEEIKVNKKAVFVTLTFKNEELNKLCEEYGQNESNAIATFAVRRFLERWRKKYKVSVKHWLITELGHAPHSERIHLHGLLFTDKSEAEILSIWKYGNIFCGNEISNKTINYITKYVTKIDTEHKNYVPTILCSPGIGKNYLKSLQREKNKYQDKETQDYYKTPTGHKIALPIYYKRKIYNEEERELLWIQKMNNETKYIRGIPIKIRNDEDQEYFNKLLEEKQAENIRLGYGDSSAEWKKKYYNVTKNHICKQQKINKYRKNKTLFYKELEKKVKKVEKKLQLNLNL